MRLLLRLCGGLGNQLFQISKAVDLVKDVKSIHMSTTSIKKYKVVHEYVTDKVINLDFFNRTSFMEDLILSLRIPRLVSGPFGSVALISDNSKCMSFNQRLLILDGYFQDNDISRIKNLKKYLINKNKDSSLLCSIHLRGGDFVKLGYSSNEINKFYDKAIKSSPEVLDNNNTIVVTDDIGFSNQISSISEFKKTKNTSDHDFDIIRNSKIKIYHNSTFAIAAAALGREDAICITSGKNIYGKVRSSILKNEVVVQ